MSEDEYVNVGLITIYEDYINKVKENNYTLDCISVRYEISKPLTKSLPFPGFLFYAFYYVDGYRRMSISEIEVNINSGGLVSEMFEILDFLTINFLNHPLKAELNPHGMISITRLDKNS
jgi:hypothetical protein